MRLTISLMRALALVLALLVGPAQAQMTLLGAGPGTKVASAVSMVTPVFAPQNTNPSATATQYLAYAGGLWVNSAGVKDVVAPIAGSISNMRIILPTSIATGQYVFTLYVNDAASSLSCTITSGTTCSSIGSVSVNALDKLEWQSCPGTQSGGTCTPGTPTAIVGAMLLSSTFTATASGQGVIFGGANGSAPSATVANYDCICSPDSGTSWNATEANISGIMPTAGTIDQLTIFAASAPGASKTMAYTIYKNGVATTLTCSMTGTGTANQTCSDTNAAHAVTVAAGDTISVQSSPTGTPTVNITLPAVRWTPTIPGEAVAINTSINALSTSATRFVNVAGGSNANTEGSTVYSAMNVAPIAFIQKKMWAFVDVAPGASGSRTWTNRFGTGGAQSSGTITCQNTTTATPCSDTTHTYSASAGDILDIQEVPAGTVAANALFKTSSVFATQ